MPNQEDEAKKGVEEPKGPETPEQTAARAAGQVAAKREGAAGAALVEAEAPQGRSPNEINADLIRNQTIQERLEESNRSGTITSAEIEQLRKVLDEQIRLMEELISAEAQNINVVGDAQQLVRMTEARHKIRDLRMRKEQVYKDEK